VNETAWFGDLPNARCRAVEAPIGKALARHDQGCGVAADVLKLRPMSRPLQVPPPGFTDLPVDEQIDYVQALWDVIAAHPEQVPVPEWHREILDERLAEYERNPNEGVPWEEFRAELQAEAKKR
jgi:putative addiction module component (TIGR02574 family)